MSKNVEKLFKRKDTIKFRSHKVFYTNAGSIHSRRLLLSAHFEARLEYAIKSARKEIRNTNNEEIRAAVKVLKDMRRNSIEEDRNLHPDRYSKKTMNQWPLIDLTTNDDIDIEVTQKHNAIKPRFNLYSFLPTLDQWSKNQNEFKLGSYQSKQDIKCETDSDEDFVSSQK